MFEYNIIFVVVKEHNDEINIKKLVLDRKAQESICKIFNEGAELFLSQELEEVEFSVEYRPDKSQIMTIDNMCVDQQIVEAINNPDGVMCFTPSAREYPDIKAIFTGVNEPEQIIAFQRFNKSQYFTNKRLGIIHTGNTLKEIEDFGMIISSGVDCVLKNNKLYFKSYSNARQVFDLAQYYRMASESEISAFVESSRIYVQDQQNFKQNADEWTRKKIALIQDSRILENNSAEEIAATAEDLGVNIQIIQDQIILPDTKKEMKDVLRVLDEDRYRGVFTNTTYETNSKRKR